MTETDSKKNKQIEFMQKHTLTQQDFKRIIAEKVERAKAYTNAVQKRKRQEDLA
jgi:excinuclease UvrABC helicase subunit UvrB